MFDAIDRETEDRVRDRVDQTRLESHVDALADLRRYPGSDDQWDAAEYIVDTLDGHGVATTLHTFEAYTSVPERASVTVTSPRAIGIDEAITTAFSANTPPDGVSGEVSALESIPEAPRSDVAGSIALVEGLPTPAKVRALETARAAGVIFTSPTPGHLHEMIVSPVWGTPETEEFDRIPDIPVVEIHRDDGKRFRTLVAGDDVEATIATEVTTSLTELPCPVAHVEGTESDRFVLVGNHIDSWHEGVTDNATAVAASMELARVFADVRPVRGIRFGFWPGHSMGRYAGSAWYADDQWLDLRENGVAYLHIDLNGLDGADHLWYQHMAEVEDEHLAALETGPLPLGEKGEDELLGASDRPGRNSDQSFWGTGLSSLLSGARFSSDHEDAGPVGGGWWWHTPADTRDKVDLDLLGEEVRLYVTILSRFCNSPVLPHDFRNTSREIRSTVEKLDPGTTPPDLTPVYDALDRLDERLETFAESLDTVPPGSGVESDLESIQVRLGNLLVPALYVEGDEYGQEPALPHELVPSLRSAQAIPDSVGPKRRAAEIATLRGRNRLAHRLRAANRVLDRDLSGSGEEHG